MSKTLNLVDCLLTMARAAYHLGRQEEARRLYHRLAGFHNLPVAVAEEAQVRLARLAMRRRSLGSARRHLTAALLYRPDSARYHQLMAIALAYGSNAQTDRAAEHFRRSLECEPQQPRCLTIFGLFCLKNDQTEEGLELLRRAAELSPDDPKLLARITHGLGTADCWDEALGLARAARFRHPRDSRFLKLWNDLLFRQLLGQQDHHRNTPAVDEEPVLLAFERSAPDGALAARSYIRHDGASSVSAPHVLPRRARRTDWKHG